MAYRSLEIDSHVPARVRSLIRSIESHYFSDVHCMLRLPIPRYRLTAGCNFSIAQVLMAAVSGISVTLYRHTGASGECFKGVLTDYYPWDIEPNNQVTPAQGAQVLYSVIRNPLTHDLGLDLQRKAKTPKVKIKRLSTNAKSQGLPERAFRGLERSDVRLAMSPTVTVRPDATVLLVEALYWGVRVMVERLTCDHGRMRAAEVFLAKL